MSETPSNITWSAILNYFRAEKKGLATNDPAEIKTLYESNANTNAFTDDDVTDLGNSFDKTADTLDDITAGTTNKHFTDTEKTKLSGIETGADVTASNLGAAIFNSTEEVNPDDNDRFSLSNGADGESRYSLWSQIKATLKTYFDGLYAALSGLSTQDFSVKNILIYGYTRIRYKNINVAPLSTGVINISSTDIAASIQGSMIVLAGGYGANTTGSIHGCWRVFGLMFFNSSNTSVQKIVEEYNEVTNSGILTFARNGTGYDVSLQNTHATQNKTLKVSVIING